MSGVVKKEQVKLSGTRVLGEALPIAAPSAGKLPQARIVERTPGAVVVEVACECGRKIYLNCRTE